MSPATALTTEVPAGAIGPVRVAGTPRADRVMRAIATCQGAAMARAATADGPRLALDRSAGVLLAPQAAATGIDVPPNGHPRQIRPPLPPPPAGGSTGAAVGSGRGRSAATGASSSRPSTAPALAGPAPC